MKFIETRLAVPQAKAPFLFGLQYLRGFAALYVVLFHLNTDLQWSLFAYGDLGVQLFFMISGFVITQAHSTDRGLSHAMRFVRKRAIRIYPAYLLAFIPVALIFHFMPQKGFAWHREAGNVLRNLLLIHDPAQSILGVSWTLVYELMFYGIFCGWVILLRQKLSLLLAGWWILVCSNLFFFHLPPERFIFLSQINLYFIAGCVLALVYRKLPYKITGYGLLAALIGFIICPFLFHTPIAIFVACFILCFAGIAYSTATPLQPFIYLGNASYAIYLTHLTVIAIATSFVKQPLFVASLFFVCLSIGLLFYRYIEAPVLRYLNQRFAGAPNKNHPALHPVDWLIRRSALRSG